MAALRSELILFCISLVVTGSKGVPKYRGENEEDAGSCQALPIQVRSSVTMWVIACRSWAYIVELPVTCWITTPLECCRQRMPREAFVIRRFHPPAERVHVH